MIEIIDKCSDRKYIDTNSLHNEDGFFSRLCTDIVNIKKPTVELAKEFSIETIYSDESFGIHKPWLHIKPEQIKNINEFCPGLDELITLQ